MRNIQTRLFQVHLSSLVIIWSFVAWFGAFYSGSFPSQSHNFCSHCLEKKSIETDEAIVKPQNWNRTIMIRQEELQPSTMLIYFKLYQAVKFLLQHVLWWTEISWRIFIWMTPLARGSSLSSQYQRFYPSHQISQALPVLCLCLSLSQSAS